MGCLNHIKCKPLTASVSPMASALRSSHTGGAKNQ
nr:MAG TPA: hypothetical protein [Caudoviricetes sp.]